MASNSELECRWHFAEQLGGRDDGPNDPMEGNFKRTPYASLIRESIQNSLDAVDDDSIPVRVEFQIKKMTPGNYPAFYGLKEHLRGCMAYFPQARENYGPMLEFLEPSGWWEDDLYYIKVADYNTIGMDYKPDDRESTFYAFVRAAGVSNKSSETSGGSFGFGKAAYFYISPIRTVLVSTLTPEGHTYFEGVSSLCTHFDGQGRKCVSVGYYDNADGHPVEDPQDIPHRFRRNEIGTDINIMGIRLAPKQTKEDIYEEMAMAVLRNFWLAILHGKLDVKIGETEINEDNIAEMIEARFPEPHDTSRKMSRLNPRPYFDAVRGAGADRNHILIQEELPTLGRVSFYAVKMKEAQSSVLHMRSPRMVVMKKSQPGASGFYGVFFCEDERGDALLRRIENPAHSDWDPRNWKDESGHNNRMGKAAWREVQEFLVRCIEKLSERSDRETLNIRGLDQYLYIPTAVENDEDDDLEAESLVSQPTGEFKDDGASITTDGTGPDTGELKSSASAGKVLVRGADNANPSERGPLLSGTGTHRAGKGGGVGNRKINRRNAPAPEDGTPGKYLSEIPVRYRAFAQNEAGALTHIIVIHSDFDVPEARIDLLVGGDQTEESLNIVSASRGSADGNSVTGLHISRGRNKIKIRFADELPHAIKLDAYEIK